MNKSNIQKIYTRIGHWIKFERKNRLEISGDMKYSQEKFILLDVNERFSDFVFNEAICARSSLSRIENGRVIYETPLITFFLKRLNKRYRIIEMEHFLIDCILDAFHCYIFKNNGGFAW